MGIPRVQALRLGSLFDSKVSALTQSNVLVCEVALSCVESFCLVADGRLFLVDIAVIVALSLAGEALFITHGFNHILRFICHHPTKPHEQEDKPNTWNLVSKDLTVNKNRRQAHRDTIHTPVPAKDAVSASMGGVCAAVCCVVFPGCVVNQTLQCEPAHCQVSRSLTCDSNVPQEL